MIKLVDLLNEDYGGPGKLVLPSNHIAGLKVPKGGSCCANCKWWNKKEQICTNTYYSDWAQTNKIPYSPLEFCSDWWEPK
jgi:hypothetical protein